MRPLILLLALSALGAQELFTNGGFEQLEDGWPVGLREQRELAEIVEEDGDHFLRLSQRSVFARDIPIEEEWQTLRLSLRLRLDEVQLGAESWHDARVVMSWHDAAGGRVGDWPQVIQGSGDAPWSDHTREYQIPEGAATLRIGPAFFAAGGHADFDDLSLQVTALRPERGDSPRPQAAPDTDDLGAAWRSRSATRSSVCLNGLWRFQPVLGAAGEVPPAAGSGWSWFKVPGIWPNTYPSWQTDTNASLMAPNRWLEEHLDWGELEQAWYQRRLVCPPRDADQRSLLRFAMVQTHARIFVDGREVGQQQWPGGSVDLTEHLRPGSEHELALLVTARPLLLDSTIDMGPGRSFKDSGSIRLRGLTGDVFLDTVGSAPALDRVAYEPRTADDTITLRAEVSGEGDWHLGLALEAGGELPPVAATRTADGRLVATLAWPGVRRWDLHDPHLHTVRARLYDGERLVDETLPTRIGFRDFRIEGRDFILNGSRVALRALLSHNIDNMADLASEAGCRRTMAAAQAMGFNALITHNYHFKPGGVGEMDAFYRAADEAGILIAASLPHAGDFGWKLDDPVVGARYREQTAWLIDRLAHHPSVVLYTMNHNATGYSGDQNPLVLDGSYVAEHEAPEARDWSRRDTARLAQAMAKAIDPTRPVYHHSSGGLGEVYSLNCYLNWSPMQERADWLERWQQGEHSKPLFFVEWGLPHVASWSSYRGPAFIWRTEAPQAVWASEFAAAIIGEEAYRYDASMREQVAHEEMFYRRNRPIPFGYLAQPLRRGDSAHTYTGVQRAYVERTWKLLRARGLSAILPWDQENLWRPTGAVAERSDNPDRWVGLQAPGIVPDLLHHHKQAIDSYDPAAFRPSDLGETLARWNRPVIAFIGGAPGDVTEAGHTFVPGETVEKQIVVINEGRRAIRARWRWWVEGTALEQHGWTAAEVGQQARVPLAFPCPEHDSELKLEVTIGDQVETHALAIHALTPRTAVSDGRIALYDPAGDTAAWLRADGIAVDAVEADSELDGYDLLIVGRRALELDGDLPGLGQVAAGLQVLIAPQTSEVLSQRLGLRVTEHGLRRLWPREADHPFLTGIEARHLRDWRGAASMLPPYVDDGLVGNPRWRWCGFDNTRVWRAGTRGTVCQVAIEEPTTGPWRSLVDGGFDLQYSALLEHRLGAGRIVLCQLDLEDRGADEPAAIQLRRNLVAAMTTPLEAAPARSLRYAGEAKQRQLLQELGAEVQTYAGEPIGPDQILVLGPGHGMDANLRPGGVVIALGLEEQALRRLLPEATVETGPRLPDLGPLPALRSVRGISPAELHWRSELTVADTDGAGTPALRHHRVDGADVFVVPGPPSRFEAIDGMYVRTSIRRATALVAQLLRNHGVALDSPLPAHLATPAGPHRLELDRGWVGRVDRDDVGREQGWHDPDHDAGSWKPIAVPGMFDLLVPELAGYDGTFWYRLDFATPALLPKGELELVLGAIDDESWVWLNGEFLGEVTKATHPEDYWAFDRRYPLRRDQLRQDGHANTLVIRVVDGYKNGGIRSAPHILGAARWLDANYRQVPVAEDDPYRYYRW